MASILLPTATITLLLLVLAPTPSVSAFVTDKDGDPLENGWEYYILPHGSSGGLTVAGSPTNEACPLYVSPEMNSNGSPVRISSPLRIRFVPTSVAVVLSFDKVITTCNKEMRWWVSPSDESGNSYVLVGTDGPFKSTYAFKIEEAKSGNKNEYNIKFCHIIESKIFRVSKEECKDVTILENGVLGVKHNAPLSVSFAKVITPKIAMYV